MKIEALSIAVQARMPVLLWGNPGIGKTAILEAISRALRLQQETIIASVREPTDFAGLPLITDNGVRLAAPDWAARVVQNYEQTGRDTILFFDEISTAPPAVQAAMLRVCFSKVAGDVQLPLTTPVVAAANPPETAAGGWDLSHPLANRFLHLDWQHDTDAWVEGMIAGFPDPVVKELPQNWQQNIPEARMMVASFIKARPALLMNLPEEESKAGREWASPRTWDMAATMLAAAQAYGASKDVLHDVIGGCIGQGEGVEFLTWLEALDLPDPDRLLANPKSFNIDDYRNDQVFAILSSIVRSTINNMTPTRWMAAWTIIDIAVRQKAPDMAATACRALCREKMEAGSKMPQKDYPIPVEQFKALMPILLKAGFKINA